MKVNCEKGGLRIKSSRFRFSFVFLKKGTKTGGKYCKALSSTFLWNHVLSQLVVKNSFGERTDIVCAVHRPPRRNRSGQHRSTKINLKSASCCSTTDTKRNEAKRKVRCSCREGNEDGTVDLFTFKIHEPRARLTCETTKRENLESGKRVFC